MNSVWVVNDYTLHSHLQRETQVDIHPDIHMYKLIHNLPGLHLTAQQLQKEMLKDSVVLLCSHQASEASRTVVLAILLLREYLLLY